MPTATKPKSAPGNTWRNRIVGHDELDPRVIVLNPKNAKAHPKAQQAAMDGVLEDVGWLEEVTINQRTGVLLDGHMRVARAIKQGEASVPVKYVDVDPAEEPTILLARDFIGTQAKLEADRVDALMRDASSSNDAVQELLAKIADSVGLYGEEEKKADPGADETAGAELAQKWGTKPGQLWRIGPHRLLIGDATDPASYGRLFGDDVAHLVFTDPPYGISYSGKVDERENQKKGGWAPIANDQLTGDDLSRFLAQTFKLTARRAADEAAWYVWHPDVTRADFAHALSSAGIVERQYLIWAKPAFTLGHADYQSGFEPCFYGGKAGASIAWYGDRKQSTVWRIAYAEPDALAATVGNGLLLTDGAGLSVFIAPRAPKGKKVRHVRISDERPIRLQPDQDALSVWEVAREAGKEVMHPTQKPPELAARALRNSTQPGQIVVDLFAGSGSTLVAAEQTDRVGYGMELTPEYAAVILERLHGMNLNPKLEEAS